MKTPAAWIACVLLLYGCNRITDNPPPLVVGTLERDRIELSAASDEMITAIHVRRGDQVNPGDILVEQDDRITRQQIAETDALLARLQARKAEMQRGPRPEFIAAARARLSAIMADLQYQEGELTRQQELLEQGLSNASERDRMRQARDHARALGEAQQAELDALLAGTTSEELDQIEAEINGALASRARQELLQERLNLRAPGGALVETIPYLPGERPQPGTVLITLLASGPPWVRAYVPEPLRSRLRTGMAASVTLGENGATYAGKIRFISAEAAFTPYYALTHRDRSRLNYLVEIELNGDGTEGLSAGIPVTVSFPDTESG